jgi:Tol biopolymer transport system component
MIGRRVVALLAGLTLLGLVVVSCTKPGTEAGPPSPLSPEETPAPIALAATATALPVPSVASFLPTATSFSSRASRPTLLPTLAPAALSPEAAATMAVWRAVDSGTGYDLYQIAQALLGVVALEWSPDGQSLWLDIASGPAGMSNHAPTASLVVSRDGHKGWPASRRRDSPCSTAHSWSPDGRRLVYIQDRQLWFADADGQNPRSQPLPPEAGWLHSVLYSPGATMIAMLGGRTGAERAHYDVWILDVATGTQGRIIEDGGRGPCTWSPSGSALACLGGATASDTYPLGAARLWIVEIGTGRRVSTDLATLPGTEGCLGLPVWVMDGQKVLVTVLGRLGVWIVDLDGHVERLDERVRGRGSGRPPGLTAPHLGGYCDGAVVSSDGRYVVYTAGGYEMVVMDLGADSYLVLGEGDLCHGVTRIAWAPQDPQFLRWGYGSSLELVSAIDGVALQLASSGLWPAWSPDGRQVAYWRPEAEGLALWLLNLDDGGPEALVSPSPRDSLQSEERTPFFYDMLPQWSPQGNEIAFVSFRGDLPQAYLVQLAD